MNCGKIRYNINKSTCIQAKKRQWCMMRSVVLALLSLILAIGITCICVAMQKIKANCNKSRIYSRIQATRGIDSNMGNKWTLDLQHMFDLLRSWLGKVETMWTFDILHWSGKVISLLLVLKPPHGIVLMNNHYSNRASTCMGSSYQSWQASQNMGLEGNLTLLKQYVASSTWIRNHAW